MTSHQISQKTNIYVRKVPFTTGGISKPASSLSQSDFQNLEASLLQVPVIPDRDIHITHAEVELMAIMLNHVPVSQKNYPTTYIHVNKAISLAAQISNNAEILSVNESINILESQHQMIKCNCIAHKRLNERRPQENYDFYRMLDSLQELDIGQQLLDQSGAHCIQVIFDFLLRRQGLILNCFIKSARLQVSSIVYNSTKNEVMLLNATPDFIIQKSGFVAAFGEIESSPFVQLLAAGLGHIGSPMTKYLLGICISKQRTVNLYLIENELSQKVHADQDFVGEIRVKSLCTNVYSLIEPSKLHSLLGKMYSTITFIMDDYDTRQAQQCLINISEDPNPVLRKSERKQRRSLEESDSKSVKF